MTVPPLDEGAAEAMRRFPDGGPYVPPMFPPPPSDDVRSALADDLDLIGAALSKYRHPSGVTHAYYRVAAALRSAPVSAPVAWRRVRSDGVVTYWETEVPNSTPLYEKSISAPATREAIQSAADYLYEETTKLDAPISMTACLVLAKHLLRAPAVGVTREAIARTNLIRDSVPNGSEHGNCLYPDCVSSCPGRLTVSARDAVIEECAKVADGFVASGVSEAEREGRARIAVAIRSLTGAKP